MRAPSILVLGSALLALAGCGVGQGTGNQATDDLIDSIALAQADFAILDLQDGTLTTKAALPDLAVEASYRDRYLVFRAVEEGLAVQGSAAGDFGHQADERPAATAVPRFYVGVFEVTQAQWKRLAGSTSTPWTAIAPSSLVAVDGTRPAVGVSLSAAQAMVRTASARLGHGLSLPTEAQWERACRGGLAATFAWGESRDEAVVKAFAHVAETRAGQGGPFPVGTLAPNGYGLYDLHGNAWEWTVTGVLRGGSWRDGLVQARCPNRLTGLDQHATHALVGLRLVLTP